MSVTKKESNEKTSIAFNSVLAAIFLTGFKLVIGLWTGSLGILSEAAHSALDLVAAAITLFAVKAADRPADKEHHFGHGKIENFSALIETLLLLITCVWIIYEAIQRLFFKTVLIEINIWSYLVVTIAIVIDISRSRALSRVAKKYNSQALEADALHFATDVWSSSVVLIGLIFANFGYYQADSIASIFVAAIVIWVSYRLGKRTVDALLDRVPTGIEDKIKLQILKNQDIEGLKGLRIRQSGSKTFVDLTVTMKRILPFEKVHSVLNKVEEEIKKIVRNVDVIIHPEPVKSSDESFLDKIKLIASKYDVNVHELEIHVLKESNYSIDLHIESNPEMNFKDAHNQTIEIEKEIREEIPNISKIIIHIENSLQPIKSEIDVTNSSGELLNNLRTLALTESEVKDCSNFSVFEENDKLKIMMDCGVEGDLKICDVHNLITKVENNILTQYKNIEKITIHAEPYN